MVLSFKYFVPRFSAAPSDENPMMSNRSMLKDFIASIATVSGDLSNITAPPFVLDPKSVVEIPAFWAENPSLFISPTSSSDPAERALLILKSFLAGMKSQCYMGHTEEEGVKKPLNAFLGEVFLGHWQEERSGTTRLVSEQVSHHPPITACRVWNEEHGVIAEGFNRQKITFNGSVNIMSSGYALKSLTKLDEHYLLPLPDFKVKGVLSGAPYPETSGVYYIPSTNGYFSKIEFFGKGFFSSSGKRHEFEASVYREEDGEDQPIYTIKGEWNKAFTLRDERTQEDIEVFEVDEQTKNCPGLQLPPIDEMDPWESRRAWKDTIDGIKALDFGKTGKAKGKLEQGQRDMRKQEEAEGEEWKQLFFKKQNSLEIVKKLEAKIPNSKKGKKDAEEAWVFDIDAWNDSKRPFHADKPNPDNTREGDAPRASVDSSTTEDWSLRKGRSSRTSIDTLELQKESDDERQSNGNVGSAKPSNGGLSSKRPDGSVDVRVGTVEDGRTPNADGLRIDVGRQPERPEIEGLAKDQPGPQIAQRATREEVNGSGVEGLSLNEKRGVEDMLRDKYASGPPSKKQ